MCSSDLHQIVTLLLRFSLQIAQAAEQTFGIRLSDGFRIDVPAADGVANVNVGLEIAPRIEEGRLIFDFSALLGGFGNHIAVHPIHFMEAGDADEADDDFVVSRRGDVSQIVAATAVIFRITDWSQYDGRLRRCWFRSAYRPDRKSVV